MCTLSVNAFSSKLTVASPGISMVLMLSCCTAVPAAGACRGVFWDKKSRRWRCQLGHKNKKIFLGYFGVAEDAARAYDQKLVELHGGAGGYRVHGTGRTLGYKVQDSHLCIWDWRVPLVGTRTACMGTWIACNRQRWSKPYYQEWLYCL